MTSSLSISVFTKSESYERGKIYMFLMKNMILNTFNIEETCYHLKFKTKK